VIWQLVPAGIPFRSTLLYVRFVVAIWEQNPSSDRKNRNPTTNKTGNAWRRPILFDVEVLTGSYCSRLCRGNSYAWWCNFISHKIPQVPLSACNISLNWSNLSCTKAAYGSLSLGAYWYIRCTRIADQYQ
jgi:hypothetical protein